MINEAIFDRFPQLESERLIFREFTLDDAHEIQSIRSNEEVMEFMDSDPHITTEISNDFVAGNIDAYATRKGLFWAIIEKSSNQFIGDFAYWRLDRKNHRGEIGYTLKPEFWGQGYMSEAMKTLINFGFNEMGIHSIEANINPSNSNSKKVLLKMGFEREAYFKENYFYDGEYLDSEIYSLLESNFIG